MVSFKSEIVCVWCGCLTVMSFESGFLCDDCYLDVIGG